MGALLAALALACAFPPSGAQATEATVHVAQMARDVTDAVRKQRNQTRARGNSSRSETKR